VRSDSVIAGQFDALDTRTGQNALELPREQRITIMGQKAFAV